MSQLADLFPGFETRTIETSEAKIFTRIGGSGPPLLFLHGYPQTHVMWHRVMPELAKHFTCILIDLRGYGNSSIPEDTADHYSYSKRAMALDCKELMKLLGYDAFSVLSHDRGARVAYRLELDHPGCVEKMVILDIVPTYEMWHGLNRNLAIKTFHWTFMAQPYPVPEKMIGADPVAWLDNKLADWSAAGDLTPFHNDALDHYRHFFSKPERLHATIEDYRAGATYDLKADEEDKSKGNKINCPIQVLWGNSGIPSEGTSVLDIWQRWANDVQGQAIQSGHFLVEENPEDTLACILPFLQKAE